MPAQMCLYFTNSNTSPQDLYKMNLNGATSHFRHLVQKKENNIYYQTRFVKTQQCGLFFSVCVHAVAVKLSLYEITVSV